MNVAFGCPCQFLNEHSLTIYQNLSLNCIKCPLLPTTVKLDFKELLIKEQIDFKELFTDYQLFYTINLLLNKELVLI